MKSEEFCFKFFPLPDTTTEANENYQIFDALNPGLVIRVNAPNEVHISLQPLSIITIPRIEIFIGIANNTRSAIRINEEENDVVNIRTPDILNVGGWSDFRVVWANFVITVWRGNEQFPFMGWNMNELWPISHYGLRSP